METNNIKNSKTHNNEETSHYDITGKVVGISEEKDKSTINILLDCSNMEFQANKREYKLGETLELDVEILAVKRKYA